MSYRPPHWERCCLHTPSPSSTHTTLYVVLCAGYTRRTCPNPRWCENRIIKLAVRGYGRLPYEGHPRGACLSTPAMLRRESFSPYHPEDLASSSSLSTHKRDESAAGALLALPQRRGEAYVGLPRMSLQRI